MKQKDSSVSWNLNLRTKLILLFFLLGILPILVTNFYSFSKYKKNFEDNITILNNQSLLSYQSLITERYDKVRDTIYEILVDKKIKDLTIILNDPASSEETIASTKNQLISRLSMFSFGKEYIDSIVIVTNSNRYCAMTNKHDQVNSLWYDEDKRKEIFNEIPDKYTLYFAPLRFYYDTQKSKSVAIECRIGEYGKSETTYGALIMTLNQSILQKNNHRENALQDVTNLKGITNLIINNNKTILISDDNKYDGMSLNKYTQTILNTGKYQTKTYPIDNTTLSILNIIDTGIINSEIMKSSKIILLIAILVSIITFILLIGLTSSYTNSIKRISTKISDYSLLDNNQDTTIQDIQEKDDLFAIASQFNRMTTKNKNLLQLVHNKNEEIIVAIENEKRAEIAALEAQINPHFLYNTLDSINWMAIENNQIEISTMLSNLGDILRYSISHIDTVVPMKEEVNWLKKYCYLQQERFSNSFTSEILIEKECEDIPIHKLLFQPIIENAIIHGMEGKKKGGVLRVTIALDTKNSNYVNISIANNGNKMEEQQLEKIRALIKNPKQIDLSSIGLSNTINRINMYKGNDTAITVTSSEKETIFTLHLPTSVVKNIEGKETDENSSYR